MTATKYGSGRPDLLFISFQLPRPLLSFRDVATVNPVSYMIEGLRSLVITGWDAQALLLGFGCTLGLIGVALLLATRQLKVRMART